MPKNRMVPVSASRNLQRTRVGFYMIAIRRDGTAIVVKLSLVGWCRFEHHRRERIAALMVL
jgi:hypothetical protein